MKLLVADDHELISGGVISFYNKHYPEIYVVSAKNKSELIYQLNETNFSVILQDLQFGKEDARKILSLIKSIRPEIKAIILSSHIDPFSIKSAIASGYDGYISKSAPIAELPVALQEVLNGKTYFSSDVQERFTEAAIKGEFSSELIQLTEREKEVLMGIQNELSTKEIALQLHLSEKTIEAYRSNLFVKFGVKNVAGLVKQAILNGYIH